MQIFIGCSSESKETLRLISSWIEQKNFKAVPWDTPGLFRPGISTFQSLINISRMDGMLGAIFIFSDDDKVWHRNALASQPRDNVLIEYGLFVGALGSEKAIICSQNNPKLASDVKGINFINVSKDNQHTARIEVESWLDSLI